MVDESKLIGKIIKALEQCGIIPDIRRNAIAKDKILPIFREMEQEIVEQVVILAQTEDSKPTDPKVWLKHVPANFESRGTIHHGASHSMEERLECLVCIKVEIEFLQAIKKAGGMQKFLKEMQEESIG